MTPRQCPDCQRQLRAGQATCRCGWVVPAEPRAYAGRTEDLHSPGVACELSPDCPRPTRSRMRVEERLVAACDECALAYRNERAARYMAAHGLTREPGESAEAHTARLRAFLREKIAGVARRHPAVPVVNSREVGEDEDYRHAVPSDAQNVNGALTGGGAG